MELVDVAMQYGTAIGVAYTLWQILWKQARWRSEADTKLQSIDVTWKPYVNSEIQRLSEEAVKREYRREEQHKELLAAIRENGDTISELDKHLAVSIQRQEDLTARVERLEQSH